MLTNALLNTHHGVTRYDRATITLADVFSAPLTTIENGGHFLGSDGYLDFPQLWQHITQ